MISSLSYKIAGFSFIVLGLTTCTRHVADPDACYNDQVKQIIVTNCTNSGCHNPTDKRKGYDFTNYEGVMKAVKAGHSGQSDLYTTLNASGGERMPPSYSLSKEEKYIIKHWINNGAKNNTCSATSCDTTKFKYTNISQILRSKCAGCHNKSNSSGGILLDTYNDVVTAANKAGAFLGSIKQEAGYSAMPKFSSKLLDCEISNIEKWVRSGMPNN
jgi:uncharacterized membrane protein